MVAGTLGLIASGAGLLSSAFGVGKSVYDARHQEELPGASGAMRATGSLSLMNLEDIMSQQGMSASTTQRMNEQASRTTDKQLENINEIGPVIARSVYDFFHIVMKVKFKRIPNSSDVKQITIHMDIEIPIDR